MSEDQMRIEADDEAILQHRISAMNATLARRDREIALLKEQVATQNATLESVYASIVWRLISHMRFYGRMIESVRKTYSIIQTMRGRAGGVLPLLKNGVRLIRREGFTGLKRKVAFIQQGASSVPRAGFKAAYAMDLYSEALPADYDFEPKISVIIPNYNHAAYLRMRLDSVYAQTYQNFEVILLDDCSKDESRNILQEYADKYPDKTTICFNETNSGGVFRQWEKGLALAKGELIWIAESDDYCDANFLHETARFFKNQAVMLAYCRTDFVKGESPTQSWTIEEYLDHLRLDCWARKKPFIRSAHWLVNNAWGIKNIVPNVSSAVFRHPGSLDNLAPEDWTKLKLCGDWIFYLAIIRGGLVAYTPATTNYYRQHDKSTSLGVQKTTTYYQEYEVVVRTLLALYRLDSDVLMQQKSNLYDHWISQRGATSAQEFSALYDLDRARQQAKERKPNILMVGYALCSGGGETFPIFLANMLKKRGYSVSFLNCNQQATEYRVRKMLSGTIPLIELENIELIEAVCHDMGIEIVHSHHSGVDSALCHRLAHSPDIKRVVTMHGMYEMMSAKQLKYLLPILDQYVDRFVYTAEKNLPPFPETFRRDKGFVKIDNALPLTEITPIQRRSLGIEDDAFVLCLVTRAMPEKGWQEAIDAVIWANQNAHRKVHLLMIGEGPEFVRTKAQAQPNFIHLLGFCADIRNYFAASDMGFIPSRFKGESFPLVLIDCLHAGRPILASNVGEISDMLKTEEGLAGELFDLENWTIPVEKLGRRIVELAENTDYFAALCRRVPEAALKFDPVAMVEKYEKVYENSSDKASDDIV